MHLTSQRPEPAAEHVEFFHGLDAKRQQANMIKWCIPHELNHHEICGGFRC
jgi:hypothetical protein